VDCPRKQINGKTLFLPVEGENLRKKRVKTRLFDEKKKSTRINTFLLLLPYFNGFNE
jgi:hypothetical protein